jgi:hypothetical protein
VLLAAQCACKQPYRLIPTEIEVDFSAHFTYTCRSDIKFQINSRSFNNPTCRVILERNQGAAFKLRSSRFGALGAYIMAYIKVLPGVTESVAPANYFVLICNPLLSYNILPEDSRYLVKMLVSGPNHAHAIIVRLDVLPIFVDPDNWEWKAESRAVWKPAEENWRHFCAKWYGATESQSASLVDPKSPSLSLEPLPPRLDPSISSSIFVRNSYVTMFDIVWARAISSQGRHGVILTGQPGNGAYLHSHIHYCVR